MAFSFIKSISSKAFWLLAEILAVSALIFPEVLTVFLHGVEWVEPDNTLSIDLRWGPGEAEVVLEAGLELVLDGGRKVSEVKAGRLWRPLELKLFLAELEDQVPLVVFEADEAARFLAA